MVELIKPEIIQVAQALNCLPEKQSGGRHWGGNCPAKHESDGGRCFNIWADTQSWHCFHCGAGGDVFELIKTALDCDFQEALSWAKEKGLISGNGHDTAAYAELRKTHQILTDAARFFHDNLTEPIREHLQKHYGFTNEIIKQYQIGYAPLDKSALKKHLMTRGHDLADIKKTGLLGKYDDSFFQGQIVFSYWHHGLVKYFIGRQTPEMPEWKKGKYEKLPTTELIKNAFFYGEDSIRRSGIVYLTEGVTDCLAALQHGLPSISPVTTQFRNQDHPKLLSLVKGKRVFLVPDNEENQAGMKGAQETLAFLKKNGVEASIITLPRPAGKA
jgi:DNA primase